MEGKLAPLKEHSNTSILQCEDETDKMFEEKFKKGSQNYSETQRNNYTR